MERMSIQDFRALMAKTNGRDGKKAAASEHDLQVACVRKFRLEHPDIGKLLFAIPNGGQRNEIVAAKLKAEGATSGVPDLFLAVPRGDFHGLWIEMKNGKAGRLSENQKEMIQLLMEQGYATAVCHTAEEFDETIGIYLNRVNKANKTN